MTSCVYLPSLLPLYVWGYSVLIVREQETLLASAPLLEGFVGLRYLTFMASGDSCYELDDEATVAERWANACPTLTTIILPKGRVWFAGRTGGWVHL